MFAVTFVLTSLLAMTYVVQVSETKRVISIPVPSTSHIKYHISVARALAKRGHDVWVNIPTYMLEKDYLDMSGFKTIPCEFAPGIDETFQRILSGAYFERKPVDYIELLQVSKVIIDSVLRNDSFIRSIEMKNPDLIVIDNIPTFYALSIIPYKLGIPFAYMGSYYDLSMFRVPFSLAEIPPIVLPYNNKMTFLQKVYNTFLYMLSTLYNPYLVDDVSAYIPGMKNVSVGELVRQAEIILVEQDHVLDYPKPTLPNVKLIGGIVARPAKALPPNFQSFMDSANEGVAVVSFGGTFLHLPEHISDKMLQVLLELPMKSVFRSDLTSPNPKKILTAPWIPQNDLLGHPHTKVFVSHCGKNGQYEALYHAVPIVCTPLFTDQHYNAERVRVKGFAEVLDLNTCTAEQMKSTILTVANEPRYKQAVVKHSRLFKELYGVPMETAAYWLEHVMEYGGDYMRSAGQQMPFYQYVLLDVFLFIGCVVALAVGLFYVLVKAICTCVRRRKLKVE